MCVRVVKTDGAPMIDNNIEGYIRKNTSNNDKNKVKFAPLPYTLSKRVL